MPATFLSKEWAESAKDAINSFPDDAYRETKLFMYWDWIAAAKQSFKGSLALNVRDLPSNGSGPQSRYVTFTFADGNVTDARSPTNGRKRPSSSRATTPRGRTSSRATTQAKR